AELFIVGAQLSGKPALFIVESSTKGVSVKADPSMGIRGAALGRVELDNVSVPLSARLGGEDVPAADSTDNYLEAIALARLGWAALGGGTAHAVLHPLVASINATH